MSDNDKNQSSPKGAASFDTPQAQKAMATPTSGAASGSTGGMTSGGGKGGSMPDPETPAASTKPRAKDEVFGASGKPGDEWKNAPKGSESESEKAAADMAGSARHEAHSAKEHAKERASELHGEAKSRASGAVEYAKDMAEDRFRQGKDYASSEVEAQAARLRAAGEEWGDDSYPAQAAGYLADGLSQAAEAIREQDLPGLMDDMSRFARRNPGMFLGGAALLGFAVARVMKASERAEHRGYDYGNDRYRSARASSGYGPRYDAYGESSFDPPAPGVRNTPYDRPTGRGYMS